MSACLHCIVMFLHAFAYEYVTESTNGVQILDEAVFHFVLMPLGKVWIHLLSTRAMIKCKIDWIFKPWYGSLWKGKPWIHQTSCTQLKNLSYIVSYLWQRGWVNTNPCFIINAFQFFFTKCIFDWHIQKGTLWTTFKNCHFH